MQILHRLWRFRDLRAVFSGARPPADGVPVRSVASEWKGAPSLPNHPKPTFAVGLRPAIPVVLVGTGPESGAVPRGRQRQRAIRFHLSQERDRLPDRVCCGALVRQTLAHSGDGRAHARQHDCPPVGTAACPTVCAAVCLAGWPADSPAVCMPARSPVWQAACSCPLPVR
jgi:hypothetical protein